jgi:hypothetical protein
MMKDPALDVLLDLNGEEFHEENGYWYKIEAKMVEITTKRPHGIRYNLTLHDNHNLRIMGFDNAHAVKSKKIGKFKGQIIEYDHLHKDSKDKGTPYAFSSAEQLLKDFFDEVNRILKEVTK